MAMEHWKLTLVTISLLKVSTGENVFVSIDDNSTVAFNNGMAKYGGGLAATLSYSNVFINGNKAVTFKNNNATYVGGSVYCLTSSKISFKGNSTVLFTGNTAVFGGAIFFLKNIVTYCLMNLSWTLITTL